MHLLSVNTDFQYDSIYALGVVTTFDRFMKGYRPGEDLSSIFNALCQSVSGAEASQYRQDAEALVQTVSQLSKDDLGQVLDQAEESPGTGLQESLNAIAHKSDFKYSRLFAIGLLTVLETIDEAIITDDTQRGDSIQKLCELLKLPKEKVEKDLDIYRGNLEKLQQAQEVLEDVLKADRKKREDREAATPEAESGDASAEDGDSSSEDSAAEG